MRVVFGQRRRGGRSPSSLLSTSIVASTGTAAFGYSNSLPAFVATSITMIAVASAPSLATGVRERVRLSLPIDVEVGPYCERVWHIGYVSESPGMATEAILRTFNKQSEGRMF